MADPHESKAGALVFQIDVEEAVNKAVDAQLEAKTAHERAVKAERTAIEIRQSSSELLERLRNLEHQVLGHAQASAQPRPMSSMRRCSAERTINL